MSMSSHIFLISRSLNYHLNNIGRIRSYIDNDTCHHAVRCLVIFLIDFCSSLLYGQSQKKNEEKKNTQKLQKIKTELPDWSSTCSKQIVEKLRTHNFSSERLITLATGMWTLTNACIQK